MIDGVRLYYILLGNPRIIDNSQRLEVRIFEVLCVIFVDFSESCSFSMMFMKFLFLR